VECPETQYNTITILSDYRRGIPDTVAEGSKARTVLARLDAGIVGSNPTRGMDVYVYVRLFYVCIVLCR
jgi:hypothetical protein